ncbi:hypothetical protein [Paenibacillus sp. OAS669]|uniref:hypothetical protein n=1 Tax=Paenibacillus sp. OAS669 TaxID=2663821 RepID=UPI001789001C|nr:hypothetical protein [Paenibacillus sp. OAS669]MBE1442972.1 hypothetical protein [Paenibacillus sp. OAS669]
MRAWISKLLCCALLLQPLAAGVFAPEQTAAAAVNDGEVTLLEEDFSTALEGLPANQLGFDYSALPAGASSDAVIEEEPTTKQKALHLSVNHAGESPFLISKTFGESKTGTIRAEITFMQPGTSKKQDQLLQLYNSGVGTSSKYLVIGGLDPGKGAVYWTDTAPADLKASYQLNQWHTMKLEVNTQNKRFSLWLDGVPIRAREKANLFSANDEKNANAFNFKKLVIGTPAGDGEVYIRSVMVTHTPIKAPDAPQIAYWVGRNNQSIAMWIYPDTAATKYSIKIKAREEDPWYTTSTYTGTPTSYPFLASPSASNEWDYTLNKAVKITLGKPYIIGVSAITRDEVAKVDIEGEITQFEAIAYEVTPVATPEDSIFDKVLAYENYNAHRWSVQSGLHPGDEPFADRASPLKIVSIPDKYREADWIKTHVDTMKYSGPYPQIATFSVRDQTAVYVAMDQRETLPNWLKAGEGWTDTGEVIQLADPALSYTFKVYKKLYGVKDEVKMPWNNYTEYNSGKNAGYFVFAERVPTDLKLDPVKAYTNVPSYTISGTVASNVYSGTVASSVYNSVYSGSVTLSVYQNKLPVYSSLLTQDQYKVDLKLVPGANLIEVYAQRPNATLFDRVSAVVHYDQVSPEFRIDAPPPWVRDAEYALRGSINKDALVTIKLNGAVVADSTAKAGNVPFTYPLKLIEGANTIEVSAADIAGNLSTVNFVINYEYWIGEPETVTFDGKFIDTVNPAEDVLAWKQISNPTATLKHVTLWFVLYDSHNAMVDYSSVDADIEPGQTKTLQAGFRLPSQTSGYKVKAFVWDSLTGMKPYSGVMELD